MVIAINEILENERVVTHFQPIVSVASQGVFGMEALSRGVDAASGRVIPPYQLFMAATAEDRMLELEGLCRKKALESFKKNMIGTDLILFLNFEVSILDHGIEYSGQLVELAGRLGIPPQRVAIEILESKVENTGALLDFIAQHRQAGFLIAVDDIGAGHSNLDRIALLKPDIMKIDASLIRDIEKNYYKQEIFKSLVHLARKIGSLTLAEGVETAVEALACLELGVDFIQGYYISKPVEPAPEMLETHSQATRQLAQAHRKTMVAKLKQRRAHHNRINMQLANALAELEKSAADGLQDELTLLVAASPDAERLYVLDAEGRLLAQAGPSTEGQGGQRPLFKPEKPGHDHSLKDYYYLTVDSNLRRYTTDPYISMATGQLCVTVAHWYQDPQKNHRLLCMDMNPGAI